jgi:hypothetical protein
VPAITILLRVSETSAELGVLPDQSGNLETGVAVNSRTISISF